MINTNKMKWRKYNCIRLKYVLSGLTLFWLQHYSLLLINLNVKRLQRVKHVFIQHQTT